VAVWTFAACGVAGCGSSTATVSGTVMYKGAPVPTGEVIFHCDDGTVHASAIGAAGGYHVDRCPVGPARVRVVAQRPVPVSSKWKPDEVPLDAVAPPPVMVSLVPKRYGKVETTDLRPVLAAGAHKLDLDLND
jgi:hypothetical protein